MVKELGCGTVTANSNELQLCEYYIVIHTITSHRCVVWMSVSIAVYIKILTVHYCVCCSIDSNRNDVNDGSVMDDGVEHHHHHHHHHQ